MEFILHIKVNYYVVVYFSVQESLNNRIKTSNPLENIF